MTVQFVEKAGVLAVVGIALVVVVCYTLWGAYVLRNTAAQSGG